MKKAQAGLVGLVMMVAGIALVLGLGALVLGGFLLVSEPGASTMATTVAESPEPTPSAPIADEGEGAEAPEPGGKLSLGVVSNDAADGEEPKNDDAVTDGDASEADGAAKEEAAEGEEKTPEPTAEASTASSAGTTSERSSASTSKTAPARTAPAPRKAAPTAAKPTASAGGPATIKWTGKKPMVYTFTGADGKTYSGSRARLPAGTYGFSAAVSGLAPEKQASVVVAKGASSITIHCDEGSKTCTQK